MSEVISLNRRLQIGDETTPGTAVAGDRLLECFNFAFTPKPEIKSFRGTGRRWVSTAEMNREWAEWKIDGNFDYQGFTYLVAGAWGILTPSTHSAGTNSKDWVWTPPVSGAITPRTYTVEMGDSVRAFKTAYGLITGFGYKGSREDFNCSASMIAQAFTDNITMTSSPSAVTLAPVVGKHVNLYCDSSSGGLGGTQFTRAFDIEFSYDSAFGVFWPLNRANASFTGHADTVPKNTFKMLLETDTQGMSIYSTYLQLGATVYVRVDAVGTIIEGAIPYNMQHDMALKVTNVSEMKDTQGIFAMEYECEVTEDPTWSSGQAQKLTLTNLLTAL